jgi:hypothetical protein
LGDKNGSEFPLEYRCRILTFRRKSKDYGFSTAFFAEEGCAAKEQSTFQLSASFSPITIKQPIVVWLNGFRMALPF